MIDFQRVLGIDYAEILKDKTKDSTKGKEAKEKFNEWVEKEWVQGLGRRKESAVKHFKNDIKRWIAEEWNREDVIRNKQGNRGLLKAEQAESLLLPRTTERLTPWAEYICYQLPKGYDFLKYNGTFIDEYVCGKDGTVWKEVKWTRGFIEYAKVAPFKKKKVKGEEVDNDLYTEIDLKRMSPKIHRRLGLKPFSVKTKKLIYETFTPEIDAENLDLEMKNGDEKDLRYDNIAIAKPKINIRNIGNLEQEEYEDLEKIVRKEMDRFDWWAGDVVKAEEVALNAMLEGLMNYKPEEEITKKKSIRTAVYWRLIDYYRTLFDEEGNPKMVLESATTDEELERIYYGDFGEED